MANVEKQIAKALVLVGKGSKKPRATTKRIACGNCGELFTPSKRKPRSFCSNHCENRYRGDVCPGKCKFCADDY